MESSVHNGRGLFVSIQEAQLEHGLNSGYFSLSEDAGEIAGYMMGQLYSYLKSKQTLHLNPSFQVQLKVLSVKHVKDVQKKQSFTDMLRNRGARNQQ